MPKQAFFVKRGQDVTVIPLTGARLQGLASMIADARLNTKTVNLQTKQTEETMALTDTSRT